jgi:lysophospholipase L1-like esterase
MRAMKVRAIAKRLGLSALALLVFVLLAELAARWAEPGPMSLYDASPYLVSERLVHVHEPGFRGRWDSTWYEINSRGMRGPEVAPTFAPDELRVVALGDSCTFGKGVLEEETWPRQLEALLAAELPGRRPVVFNLGVNGYSSGHYLRVLEDVAEVLKPHLVVVGYNINDFPNPVREVDTAVFSGSAPQQKTTWRARFRRWLPRDLRDELNRSALYRYLRATYYDWNRAKDYAQMEAIARNRSLQQDEGMDKAFALEAQRFRELVERARTVDAKVAFFLFPYESMVYLDDFERGPEERVRSLAAEVDVGFVDVPEAFRARAHASSPPAMLFIRGDRYHPNAQGYATVAAAVLARLRELGWLAPAQ